MACTHVRHVIACDYGRSGKKLENYRVSIARLGETMSRPSYSKCCYDDCLVTRRKAGTPRRAGDDHI